MTILKKCLTKRNTTKCRNCNGKETLLEEPDKFTLIFFLVKIFTELFCRFNASENSEITQLPLTVTSLYVAEYVKGRLNPQTRGAVM